MSKDKREQRIEFYRKSTYNIKQFYKGVPVELLCLYFTTDMKYRLFTIVLCLTAIPLWGQKSLSASMQRQLEIMDSIYADSVRLEEVVITSRRNGGLKTTKMGVASLRVKELERLPTLLGERDLVKSFQLMPGVKAESDGTSGYNVRGGSTTQNLILLDGAPVMQPGHILGFFSVFNSSALLDAQMYKGIMPAQYGDRLSSLLDIQQRDGQGGKLVGDINVGLLSAGGHIRGTTAGGKFSYALSARRTYFDLFLKTTEDYKDAKLYFYDLNGRLSYSFSDDDKLFLSAYHGNDNIGVDDLADMDWQNQCMSLRWFHRVNNIWISNTSLVFGRYASSTELSILNTDAAIHGSVQQTGIKQDFRYHPNESHSMHIGAHLMADKAITGEWSFNNLQEREERYGTELTAWWQYDWAINPKHLLSVGLRLNGFAAMGGAPYYTLDDESNIVSSWEDDRCHIEKMFWNLDPRVAYTYRVNPKHSLKLGYSRLTQNVHAIQNAVTNFPYSRYIFSSNLIDPETADQISLGWVAEWMDGMYSTNIETYYKWLHNSIDYREGVSFDAEIEMERLLATGRGRAYGVELNISKDKGPLTGWLSYTWSRSELKLDEVNHGRWYKASNDRTHDVSLVAMYRLNKRWDFSANWMYTTGQAYSAPSGKYQMDGETVFYYAERNGYRAPDYHRLDLSASYHMRPKHKNRRVVWHFGVYNAYNHYNPYVINFEEDKQKASGMKATMTSLYGAIPFVSYQLTF